MEGSCFAVNACVPMAVAHFQHGFITKGDGIKYVVRNGTDTFYIFCLPNQRWCGTSVPIGFGPGGNFRMAWGNPVCRWDGVASGCLGVRNNVRPVQEMFFPALPCRDYFSTISFGIQKNSGPPAECNDFYNIKIVGDKKTFSKSSVHMGETIKGMT